MPNPLPTDPSLKLKGRTTGRETQRGPKPAREQAFSRDKPLSCQTKAAVFSSRNRLFLAIFRVI
jgi:hypothetical protein